MGDRYNESTPITTPCRSRCRSYQPKTAAGSSASNKIKQKVASVSNGPKINPSLMIRLNTWKGCWGGNLASEEEKNSSLWPIFSPVFIIFPSRGFSPNPSIARLSLNQIRNPINPPFFRSWGSRMSSSFMKRPNNRAWARTGLLFLSFEPYRRTFDERRPDLRASLRSIKPVWVNNNT